MKDSETREWTSVMLGEPLPAQRPDTAPKVLPAPRTGVSHSLCLVSTGVCQNAAVEEIFFISARAAKNEPENCKLAFLRDTPH